MKKKVTSVFASCVAASLVFASFGGFALADEVTEEPTYEEPTYEEPTYEEPTYDEPSYEEPASTESSSSGSRTLVSVNTYYDCDGSGNGYYEYVYSDGSVEYEDFYASSGSSSGSSDSYSDSSNDEVAEEEVVVEETVVEEETASEELVEEEELDCVEWTMDEIAAIPDVVSGVENKEYTADSAHKYDIHMDVDFDKDIVDGVLFNTSKIDFSTAGEYNMTYFVYFDREALLDYIEENDLNEEDFPGLSDETEDRFEIGVKGTVTIN